jgi:hypothetical protein
MLLLQTAHGHVYFMDGLIAGRVAGFWNLGATIPPKKQMWSLANERKTGGYNADCERQKRDSDAVPRGMDAFLRLSGDGIHRRRNGSAATGAGLG